MTGVDVVEGAPAEVDHAEEHGDEPVRSERGERFDHPARHRHQPLLVLQRPPDRRLDHPGDEGGGHAVADDVRHHQQEAVLSQRHHVEQVAADRFTRQVGRGDPDRTERSRQALRLQGLLVAARATQILGQGADEVVALGLQALDLQRSIHERGQNGARERLGDEVAGARLHRADELVIEIGHRPGDEDHLGTRVGRFDRMGHLESIHAGHAHVHDRHVERLLLEGGEGALARFEPLDLVRGRQDPLDGSQHRRVVIDDENPLPRTLHDGSPAGGRAGAFRPREAARAASRAPVVFTWIGRRTVTIVPLPGQLSMFISPPASHRIDRQIARPSPKPVALVV